MSDETADTIATYNQIATDYAERWFGVRMQVQMECFARYLGPGARVLDAGCGPGRDTAHLREYGFRVVSLDLSWRMLAEARQRTSGEWVCADLRAIPLAGGCLDGIWACASLLHLPKRDMAAALGELRRVLRRGILYVAVKQGDGEAWVMMDSGLGRFFAYYRPEELEALCRRARFRVLEWIPSQAPWLNLIAETADDGD